jgi:hypothetical protein
MIIRGRNFHITQDEPEQGGGGTTNPPPLTGTRVILINDSIGEGALASSQSLAFPAIYQNITGLQVRRMGQYSRTVQEIGLSWNKNNSWENMVFSPTSDQAQYNPVFAFDADYKYVIVQLVINDVLQKSQSNGLANINTFKDAYLRCLNRYLELGWPKNRIKLLTSGMYTGGDGEILSTQQEYNIGIKQVGVEKNVQVIDLFNYLLQANYQSMYADLVHPNDAGHDYIGRFIATQLP